MSPASGSVEESPLAVTVPRPVMNDGAGEPLVLLIAGDGKHMDGYAFLLPLLERKHRVVTVSLLEGWTGIGVQLPSIDELVGRARAAILDLGPGRSIALIGFSLAGVVAAAYTASYAGVGRLIVISASLTSSPRHRAFARTWARARALGSDGMRDFVTYSMLSPAFHEDSRPSDNAAIDALMIDPTADAAAAIFAAADISNLAPQIDVPTLVIGCAGDQVASVEQSQALFAAIPSARYSEIDCGHAALLERPVEVLSLLERFLRNPHRHAPASVIPRDEP